MRRPPRKPARVPEKIRRMGDNLFLGIMALWVIWGGSAVVGWLMRHR